ncbi:hypothetical protein ASPTUDRAFT_921956 [Aspergillus tubingensis CBS 134.48]|uniref:HhH-GPD domain-containing protein n=1 Tax=Aspergillus tubingensis (strain CBS 134.48) TaxID=767770 RepID=A0A1L9NE40_ASPTC|nr:hypothetical protein ASPTUDRAFT_921956 [Aspergillus tubingensis CBS 134.48]
MAGGKGVSTFPLVRISPPHINVDLHDSFDEVTQRTVDQILSDEASFENSFDDYSGSDGINGEDDMTQSGGHHTSAFTAATQSANVDSPYFPSKKRSKTQKAAQRHISRMDSNDDENDTESSTSVVGPNGHTLVDDGETLDDASEEDIVFASVDLDKRMDLLTFISSHPFMKKGEYPVLRSARRSFVRELRRKSRSLGMKEADLERLVAYVKKIYLELYGNGQMSLDGSGYGEEIKDGQTSPPKSSNKDNKRKRGASNDQVTTSKQEEKKTTSKKRKSLEPIANGHRKRCETDGPDANISTAKPPTSHSKISEDRTTDATKGMPAITIDLCPSGNESPEPDATQNVPVKSPIAGQAAERHNDENHRLPSPPHSEEGYKQSSVEKKTTQSEETNAETLPSQQASIKRSMTLHSSPKFPGQHTIRDSEDEEDEGEEDKKTGSSQPVSAKDELPSATQAKQPESLQSYITQHPDRVLSKKEKNRRKRDNRKQRKKKHFRASLTNTEHVALTTSADDIQQGRDSKANQTAKPNTIEVRSKYFIAPQKLKKGNVHCEERRNTHSENVLGRIPEETRILLSKLNLSSDFLSTDSDLSDVPSGFDDIPFEYSLDVSPIQVQRAPEAVEPSTPTKATSIGAAPVLPRTPRLRPQKISPYFPKPLVDPDSCLPFPPIDAPSFGLVQEQLAHDPFRLLIATIFLNRTRGGVALPVLFKVFDRFPTVEAMASTDPSTLASMIHCLGFQNQRAKKCIALAQTWLAFPPTKGRRYRKLHYPCKGDGRDIGADETIADDDARVGWEIAHLPGVGPYSLDSWRIFCRDELRGLASDWRAQGASKAFFRPEWKSVLPQDKELRAYLTWMWLKEGWVWDRHTGERTPANERVMRAARRGGVAHEEDGNWVLEMSPVKKASNGLTAWS